MHTDLDESEKLFKQEIKRFRIILDRWLDSLEENSVEELEYRSRQTSDTLKIHGRTVAKILQCLRETKLLLDVMHKSHNKTQMLIVKCKLQNLLKICDHDLQGIEDKVSDSKFLFTPHKDLSKLHQRLDSLGQVDVRSPLGDDIIRNVFLRARPEKINTVKVKQPDKIRCRLTAVVFTYNGDILAADSRNNRVLLLDAKTMKIQSTCAYPKPFFQLHLVTFDDQTCLSLIHGQMEMQFIKVKPQLRISERKMLDKVCYAVAVIKEGIFLLCSSDGPESPLHVIVMDANGIISKTIQSVEMETRLESSAYYNMAVSLDGHRLFFAQNMPSVQSRVICMTVSGKHVYTSDDSDMREVRGIVADAENNILVCCETSNNVLLMRSDGTKQKALLTSEDGINRPNTIGFRFSDGMLVVGDNGETGIGDVLSMFKIK